MLWAIHMLTLVTLVPTAIAQPGLEPAAQRGLTIAQTHCARCHSIDRVTASPLAIAPPFRTLHKKYPVENLEEALAESISTGHPTMPEFRFDPGQAIKSVTYNKRAGTRLRALIQCPHNVRHRISNGDRRLKLSIQLDCRLSYAASVPSFLAGDRDSVIRTYGRRFRYTHRSVRILQRSITRTSLLALETHRAIFLPAALSSALRTRSL